MSVAAFLALAWTLRWFKGQLGALAGATAAYAIGTITAFWLIEHASGFLAAS